MSHLSLDARAILHYLNELGYRNISADQLKEFLKGMQSPLDIGKKRTFKTESNQQLKEQLQQHNPQQKLQHLSHELPTTPAKSRRACATTSTTTRKCEKKPNTLSLLKGNSTINQIGSTKILKSKKPLSEFKFYLDIEDHQVCKKIEEQIQHYGGSVEFFLTSIVTHFVTDKNIVLPSATVNTQSLNSNPNYNEDNNSSNCPSPHILGESSKTLTSIKSLKINPNEDDLDVKAKKAITSLKDKFLHSNYNLTPKHRSRADAILKCARRETLTRNSTPIGHIKQAFERTQTNDCEKNEAEKLGINDSYDTKLSNTVNTTPYVIWQTEYAFRFFKKIERDLSKYLTADNSADDINPSNSKTTKKHVSTINSIPLQIKGQFIKIESLDRNYRPYYQLLNYPLDWPKIQLSCEDGAFRLSPKRWFSSPKSVKKVAGKEEIVDSIMTRKSRIRSSQHQNTKVQNLKKLNKKNSQSELKTTKRSTASQGFQRTTTGRDECNKKNKDSTDKQCGVCEICKIEYDVLSAHLKTKDHKHFVQNLQNYVALDTLIDATANVKNFLNESVNVKFKEVSIKNEQNDEVAELEINDDSSKDRVLDQDQNDILVFKSSDSYAVNISNLNSSSTHSASGQNNKTSTEEIAMTAMASQPNKRKSNVSPILRERSKRSTKGKHSSEKFQNLTRKSPKNPSPQKSVTTRATTLELQNTIEKVRKCNNVSELKTSIENKRNLSNLQNNDNRKRKVLHQPSGLSPPKRAMLPPSSMYKVVETISGQRCTTPQKGFETNLNSTTNVASPSIIVKFKKLRTTELELLNGEAENFMFPKRRSNSTDLPTDIDRHTTSDHGGNSNSSLLLISSDTNSPEKASNNDNLMNQMNTRNVRTARGKRAIAIAKRKLTIQASKKVDTKNNETATTTDAFKKEEQSFLNAPIQPIDQLKSTQINKPSLQSEKINNSTITRGTKISNTANITLPEATRKSTRTATAIVTAATTSSRLLQAAVEAAKSKSKKRQTSAIIEPNTDTIKQESIELAAEVAYKSDIECAAQINKTTIKKKGGDQTYCERIKTIAKLEDGMGELRTKKTTNTRLTKKNKRKHENKDNDNSKVAYHVKIKQEEEQNNTNEDDEEIDFDDDDGTIDNDDAKDEDFTLETERKSIRSGKRQYNKKVSGKLTSRAQRANNRRKRLLDSVKAEVLSDVEGRVSVKKTYKKINEAATSKKNIKEKNSCFNEKLPNKNIRQRNAIKREPLLDGNRIFDYTRSERLQSLRYAFERLPTSDLWYKVFSRQDECEEQYFQYFGQTKYHKLPYELGPVPYASSFWNSNDRYINCRLCQKPTSELPQTLPPENNKKSIDELKKDVYLQKTTISYNDTLTKQKPDDNVPNSSVLVSSQTKESETSNANRLQTYKHKHKKLHLLQKYQQEQEQLELERRRMEEQMSNPTITSLKEDSNSNSTTMDMLNEDNRLHRAGSINSNASSYESSSTTTIGRGIKIRNKHLSRAAYMGHLELPPRKSPREHASTLALVSCIIRQRQDSRSKPTSETDEPPTPPISTTPVEIKPPCSLPINSLSLLRLSNTIEVTTKKDTNFSQTTNVNCNILTEEKQQSLPTQDTPSIAFTPVEEVRFATEISETVKRMRRGRNKYDYSPPFVVRKTGRPRIQRSKDEEKVNAKILPTDDISTDKIKLAETTTKLETLTPVDTSDQVVESPNFQCKEKNSLMKLQPSSSQYKITKHQNYQKKINTVEVKPNNTSNEIAAPSIRKTGCKKGVVEFEMDNAALEALNKVDDNEKVDVRYLEWQIDKYITQCGNEYDMEPEIFKSNASFPDTENIEIIEELTMGKEEGSESSACDKNRNLILSASNCFSNSFNLCDVLMQQNIRDGFIQVDGVVDEHFVEDRKPHEFSLFNASALHSYYRKRKSLNRTGWPKVYKKKTASKQQSLQDRIYFISNGLEQNTTPINSSDKKSDISSVQDIKLEPLSPTNDENDINSAAVEIDDQFDEDATRREICSNRTHKQIQSEKNARNEGNVMTPPDSDIEFINAQARGGDCIASETLQSMDILQREEKLKTDIELEHEIGLELEEGPLMIDLNVTGEVDNEDYGDSKDSQVDTMTVIIREDDDNVEDLEKFTGYYNEESEEELSENEAEDLASSNEEDADADIEEEEDDDDNDDDDEEEEEEEEEKEEENIDGEIDDEDINQSLTKPLSRTRKILSTSPQCLRAFERNYESHTECNPVRKMMRCSESLSPVEKLHNGLLNGLHSANSSLNNAASSTPTKHLIQTSRRTPQLNGSLGSCMSPSEKAGDNSDIFTVSSDGLETDLDLSNSHSQMKTGYAMLDADECLSQHHHNLYHSSSHNNNYSNSQQQMQIYRNNCNNHHFNHYNNHNSNNNNLHHHNHLNYYHNHQNHTVTGGISNNIAGGPAAVSISPDNRSGTVPRRRLDLSKYAPTNATTCAAEAATAAVKSMAISQYLKKEVRVTCRRLRTPFRRFRYRR